MIFKERSVYNAFFIWFCKQVYIYINTFNNLWITEFEKYWNCLPNNLISTFQNYIFCEVMFIKISIIYHSKKAILKYSLSCVASSFLFSFWRQHSRYLEHEYRPSNGNAWHPSNHPQYGWCSQSLASGAATGQSERRTIPQTAQQSNQRDGTRPASRYSSNRRS